MRRIPVYTPNSGYTGQILDNRHLNRVETVSWGSYEPVKVEENMMLRLSKYVLDDGANVVVVDAVVTVEVDDNSGHAHNHVHLQRVPVERWRGRLNWGRHLRSRSCSVAEVGSK